MVQEIVNDPGNMIVLESGYEDDNDIYDHYAG